MAYSTEQMREYQVRRRAKLRAELTALLGGKCVRCGTTEKLQFDHIDPETKLFVISSGLDKPREVLLAEVAKCQLLCQVHHREKSAKEATGSINYSCGEKHPWSRLTESQVREILSSPISSRKLAKQLGVVRGTVQAARSGRSWKHISLESSNLEAQRPVKSPPSGIGGSNPSSST